MKRVIFNLKREWYDKIASGEKTVEYRRIVPFWESRLWDLRKPFRTFPVAMVDLGDGMRPLNRDLFAVFRLGYSRKYPDIVRRIVKIDIGPCPYDGWDGDYFRIHFEKEEAGI